MQLPPIFRNTNLLFYAVVFCMGLGASLKYISTFDPYPGRLHVADKIKARLGNEMLEMEEAGKEAIVKLREHKTARFSALEQPDHPVKYPVSIYSEGHLFYWNQQRILPDYEQLKGKQQYGLLQLRYSKSLVCRLADTLKGKKLEVFVMLPLYRKYSIYNNYLKPEWLMPELSQAQFDVMPASDPAFNLKSPGGKFIAAISFLPEFGTGNNYLANPYRKYYLWIMGISLLLLVAFVIKDVHDNFLRWHKVERGLGTIFATLLVIRALMLWYQFPYQTIPYKLFDPKNYGGSILSPSLGDLLVNVLILGVIAAYFFRYFFESATYRRLLALSPNYRMCIGLTMVLVSNFSLFYIFGLLRTLFFNEQWTLDISSSLELTLFKGVSLVIYILLAFIFFCFAHVFSIVYHKISQSKPSDRLLWSVYGTIIYLAFAVPAGIFELPILLVNWLFYFLVLKFRLPRQLPEQRAHTYAYFFLTAILCAFLGTYALNNYEQTETIQAKQKFAVQLITQNDALAELLLDEMRGQIKSDLFIVNRLQNPFARKEIIGRKIKLAYIDPYFDRYDVQISIFDRNGNNFSHEPNSLDYNSFLNKYKSKKYRTRYNSIFFLNEFDLNIFKRYLCFVPIESKIGPEGFIVIDLKLKKYVPGNVFPELLVDKRLSPAFQSRNYSYAIYAKSEMIYNYGNFNYERNLTANWLNDSALFKNGIKLKGFQHLAVREGGNRTVIVTSEVYSIKNLVANFSFLFIILVVCIVGIVSGMIAWKRIHDVHLTLATKIQIYLNAAFLLPLLTVSALVLSVMSTTYRNDLDASFLKRSEETAGNLSPYTEQFVNGQLGESNLLNAIYLIARLSGLDINLFATNGKLIGSSQPLIYERELLSGYLNPEAVVQVIEQRQRAVLISESVGTLQFKSVYVALRAPESGKLIGIMSIPFFDSSNELNHQITNVVSTVVIIFMAIFVVFVVLSFYASQQLVIPLKIITNRLKRTTLARNQPIEWKSKDEIGLLIGEYNKMLTKLSDSREKLSRSEKESAWREMAQQVAHEIKNPLTPMKLTLQYLQRSLQNGHGDFQRLVEKSVQSLLDQVNTLNDIATSFSTFAKMPVPKSEIMDLAEVLRHTADLYRNNEDLVLETKIGQNPIMVSADARLMSRIFTNLILNAIQSVPEGRKPHIKIELSARPDKARVSVSDNGVGIPRSLHNKIFIPNFSTKTAGAGIGLAVARRGIEHLGGRIWFDTELDKGSTFYVELYVVNRELDQEKEVN